MQAITIMAMIFPCSTIREIDSFFSHDNVAAVLREHGAVLVFPGKQAGVLMCQVFSIYDLIRQTRRQQVLIL